MSQEEQDFVNAIIDMNTDAESVKAWDGKGGGGLDLGAYDFEVIDAKYQPSKEQGKAAQLELNQRVVGPEGSPMLDRTMRSWYRIDPTDSVAQARWAALQDACRLQRGKVQPVQFIGCKYRGEVAERTYNKSDGKGGTVPKTVRYICGEEALAEPAPVAQAAKPPAVVRPVANTQRANGPAVRR